MVIKDKSKLIKTDLPCESRENDLLGTYKYAVGLESFIEDCETPMAIAIQGDWGTGKTSIINFTNEVLTKNKIKTIYFNTWQYSQFDMSHNLYYSFIHCLLKEIDQGKQEVINQIKKIFIYAISATSNIIMSSSGIDYDQLTDLVKKEDDLADSICKLKSLFQKVIDEYVKKGTSDRIVIFIDDLDRLNPNVAVELLEVIKLFIDVKHCVFVLAIDYDVVVQGVRQKFGNDVSLDKCKSFFDKIIQLPFRMPVESYSMMDMIKYNFSGILYETQSLADYAKIVIGTNPRTFKRLYNSYFLIQSIKKASSNTALNEKQQSVLFCVLCLQMTYPQLYSFMASKEECYILSETDDIQLLGANPLSITDVQLKKILEKEFDKNENVDWFGISKVVNELDKILKKIYPDTVEARNELIDAFQVSGITSMSNQKVNGIIKIDKIIVFEEQIEVNSAAKAFIKIFGIVLTKNLDKLDMCIKQIGCLSYQAKEESYFMQKEKLCINNVLFYIGTKLSNNDKKSYMDKLCNICKLNDGDVQWFSNDICDYSYTCNKELTHV